MFRAFGETIINGKATDILCWLLTHFCDDDKVEETEEETTTIESLFFAHLMHLLRPPGALEEAFETPHAGSAPLAPRLPLAHLLSIDHNIIQLSAIRTANSIVFSPTCNPIEIDCRIGIELRWREAHSRWEEKLLRYTKEMDKSRGHSRADPCRSPRVRRLMRGTLSLSRGDVGGTTFLRTSPRIYTTRKRIASG